jgi:hypothetical protein
MANEFEAPNSRKFEIYYVLIAKNTELYPEVRALSKMFRIDLLNSKYSGVFLYISAFHALESTKLLNCINFPSFMGSGI